MWKDSIRNIVVIFQTTILRIVGFYDRHLAITFQVKNALVARDVVASIKSFLTEGFQEMPNGFKVNV